MDNYRLSKFKDSIFLCGFMGTGKSTYGRRLAEELDRTFIDLDAEIVERMGKSIPEIFKTDGEEGFREAEWKTLYDLTQNSKGIIALGGGTLQNQRIVDHLKLYGLLIFIDTPFATILKRIESDTNRPLLIGEDGEPKDRAVLENELYTLMEKRRPYYQQAQIQIETSAFKDADDVVSELKKRIARYV